MPRLSLSPRFALSPKVRVLVAREYLSRVRTPAFWISTVALPVLMVAWMVLPSLIMAKSRGQLHLALVDETGRVAPAIAGRMAAEGERGTHNEFRLDVMAPEGDGAAQRAALDARVLADELDAWAWISEQGLAENRVEFHGRTVSNIITLEELEDLVTSVVREQRLSEAGYDADEVEKLVARVRLDKVRVTEEGSRADRGFGDLIVAVGLFMLLYMASIIYGNMVMQGVLEEKANRVVEVLAASATPTELMAGKLLGICLTALTQLGIWMVTALVVTAPGLLAGLASLPEGVNLTPSIVLHFFALFLLGFVLYASFYALVGAAFNNAQEAQQMASIAMIFIVLPWMVFMPVLNDPDSTLAVVTSLVPLLTPMIMMLRIAVKAPPAWQVALGYALLVAFDVFMVWLCARVYRIGILMYGKKPTIKEIWRWTRYA
jgi:ABC-2 type transport system permease protein